MRKQQSDFGWDWGPAFAPAGPWQPAYVIQLAPSQLYVRNTLVDIYRYGQVNNVPPSNFNPWVVNASLDYIGSLPEGASLTYQLADSSGVVRLSGDMENTTTIDGAITAQISIPDDGTVQTWWPVGLGPQILYNLTVTIAHSSQPIGSSHRRIGFRTIVNNQSPVDQDQIARGVAPGANWHFEINGQPYFAKGSNFIPPDPFWARLTPDKIRQLFDLAVDSGQNMLRIWASGAYSPDLVYDIADEMGILLWSEFEFGDALYPVDEEFLDNVSQEASYQVRRVNYHREFRFQLGSEPSSRCLQILLK